MLNGRCWLLSLNLACLSLGFLPSPQKTPVSLAGHQLRCETLFPLPRGPLQAVHRGLVRGESRRNRARGQSRDRIRLQSPCCPCWFPKALGRLPLLSGSLARKPAFGPCCSQTPSTSASLSEGRRSRRCSRICKEVILSALEGEGGSGVGLLCTRFHIVPTRDQGLSRSNISSGHFNRMAGWSPDLGGVRNSQRRHAGWRSLARPLSPNPNHCPLTPS